MVTMFYVICNVAPQLLLQKMKKLRETEKEKELTHHPGSAKVDVQRSCILYKCEIIIWPMKRKIQR